MYTLDTNAVVYYIKDDLAAISLLTKILSSNTPIYVSTITELELFGFSLLTDTEEQQIEAILATVSVISLDSRIARLAGSLRRLYGVKTPDSAIAATALFTGSTLVTRNVRDFKSIPNLILAAL